MATAAGDSLVPPQSISITDGTGSILDYVSLESFEMEDILGTGSFGTTVWKASHPTYNDVAVKILEEINSQEDSLKEATRLQKLCAYPKLIKVYCMAYSKDQKQFGICMELMKYGNLKDFQERRELQKIGGIPWAIRMNMLKEISEGMYDLHHRQATAILHRDLKAENIFVNHSFNVKIGDLGLSTSMMSVETKPVGGTMTHMPPEYFNELEEYPNKKWDVYSFAILLYEIGSGEPAYKELGGDSFRLTHFKKQGKHPHLRHLHSDCPDLIKNLIEECWDKNQDNRPDFKDIKPRINKLYKDKYESHFQSAVVKCSSQFCENVDEVDNEANPVTIMSSSASSTVDQANGSSTVRSDNTTTTNIPTNEQTPVNDRSESSELTLNVDDGTPQEQNSALTYGQKYDPKVNKECSDYGIQPVSDVSSFGKKDNRIPPCNDELKTATPFYSEHGFPKQEVYWQTPSQMHTSYGNTLPHQNASYPSSGTKIYQTATTLNSNYDHRKIEEDDDTVIKFIKKHLRKGYFRSLGREFKLRDAEIDAIEEDYNSYTERVHQMIVKWRQKNGTITIGDIVKCLHELEQKSLINDLYKHLSSTNF